MRVIQFGVLFLIVQVCKGYVTGGKYTVLLGDEEISGIALKRSHESKSPFLLKFPRIQFALGDFYLDVYVDELARTKAGPVIAFIGEYDVAGFCENLLDEEFSGVLFVHISGLENSDDTSTCTQTETSECDENSIQYALAWVYRNAEKFGGDKSRVTLMGLGRESSFIVSKASNRQEYRHLFQRVVVEFAEENWLHRTGLLYGLERSTTHITPPPRNLLLGYDAATVDEESVTSIVDNLEAFANSGSRVTLFNRGQDDIYKLHKDSLLFKLGLKFSRNRVLLCDEFPQLNLASWRDGVQILELDDNLSWKAITKINLFEPVDTRITDEFPVIKTTLGPLRGRHLHRGSYQADAFYHIPFASPTKRFEYSKMVEPWSDLLDARYGVRYKDCPQNVFVNFGHEDCMNLHIFVPGTFNETVSGSRLSVMVFMHGGSYAVGTAGGFKIPGRFDNALYDGTVMADFSKVIVVSVNYRLAALGFLNDGVLDNGVLDGNYGARDMVLALQWVQRHIGEYGGDPKRVTLFGESAGSSGTGLLSLSPMTEGLIHGFIQESGSPLSFFAVDFDPSVISTDVFTEMGCRADNFTAVKECLMQRGEFDFIGLQSTSPYVPWRPTIDGVFLVEDPALTTAKQSELPLLSGCNYDEVYIMAAALVPEVATDRALTLSDWEAIKGALDYVLLTYPDRQQYISDIVIHSSFDWVMDFTTEAAKRIFIRASSDYVFAAPQFRQALIRSEIPGNAPTYMYSFQIKTKVPLHREWTTNSHAFELPYVFGEGLRRTERDPLYNATADKLSLQMMTYWTNFAKTGNPNDPVKMNIDGIVWEEYNNETKPYIALNFRMTPENIQSDYRPYERELWDVLIPVLLQLDEHACVDAKTKNKDENRKISSNRPRVRQLKHKSDQPSFLNQRTSRLIKAGTICDLSEDFVRNTTNGCVRGVLSDYKGSGVEAYLGIPYAEPPTGDLRFSKTVRAQNWGDGVLDAGSYMPDCPRNSTLEGQNEDCLYLNIYRPNNTENLPVMVWIHSDLSMGSGGAQYDGKRIAILGDVVIVTFNYRIGVLGYLSMGGDTEVAGNFGLLDQNMALHWVKDNIANFGGDVSRITVLGDGDSSKAIGYHAVSNMNEEALFTHIIHQSGVGQFDNHLPLNDVEAVDALASDLGCPVDDITATVTCLKNKTTEEILSNSEYFTPKTIIDGTFLRDQPKALFEESIPRYYNYLIGFTSGEGSPDFEFVKTTVSEEQTFTEYIENEIVTESEFTNPARVKAIVKYEYKDFGSEPGSIEQKYQNAAMQMIGDKYVIAPSLMLANRTSRAQATLLRRPRNRTFVCNLVSAADELYPSWIGAPSGSFEKYFWNKFEAIGGTPESQLAERIVKYWTSFAKNGRPFGIDSDDSWKRYSTEDGEYGEINAQSEFSVVKHFPRPKYATLWNVLIPSLDFMFPCNSPKIPTPPEVNTTNGVTVRGYAKTTGNGRNYDVFRGLPYALPPVGDIRFARSTFAGDITSPNGDSLRHATIKKPRCLQTVNGARGGFASEDCLYLDIWRPNGVNLDSRPVLFWICNGGYSVRGPHSQLGDDYSCDIDGQLMALDGNFIFVRVQYRIGVLGFLSTGDNTLSGNVGISDLENALLWVVQNIGDFGGSKDKITIAGDGFGGVLAMILAGMTSNIPGATVQGVIAQSGSLTSPWAYTTSPTSDLVDLAVRTNCSSVIAAETVACLRKIDSLKLITAAGTLTSNFPFSIFASSKDIASKTKENMMDLTVDGISLRYLRNFLATMPILIGVNGGAGYHFTVESYPEIQLIFGRRPITTILIETMITNDIYLESFGTSFSEEDSQTLSNYYIPWGDTDSRNEMRRASVRYHTDEGFLIPAYDEIHSRLTIENSMVSFLYVYKERTDKFRARVWLTEGGDLGEELSVMFKENSNDSIANLGTTMREYWANFVNRGTPNLPQSEAQRWPSYDAYDKNTMIFGSSGVRVVAGYRDQAHKLWEEVYFTPAIAETTTTASTTTCAPAPTVTPVSCRPKSCQPCSVPVIGTGIGLELSPNQADVAIEALFGIALSFACILVAALLYFLFVVRRRKNSPPSISSSVISNEMSSTNDPPSYKELSSL